MVDLRDFSYLPESRIFCRVGVVYYPSRIISDEGQKCTISIEMQGHRRQKDVPKRNIVPLDWIKAGSVVNLHNLGYNFAIMHLPETSDGLYTCAKGDAQHRVAWNQIVFSVPQARRISEEIALHRDGAGSDQIDEVVVDQFDDQISDVQVEHTDDRAVVESGDAEAQQIDDDDNGDDNIHKFVPPINRGFCRVSTHMFQGMSFAFLEQTEFGHYGWSEFLKFQIVQQGGTIVTPSNILPGTKIIARFPSPGLNVTLIRYNWLSDSLLNGYLLDEAEYSL